MPARGGTTVILQRETPNKEWGVRLSGGCDLNKPITVLRTKPGSPSDGRLQPGDILLQINEYDARDVRHQDAQMLFKNSGATIRLVVQRESYRGRSPSVTHEAVDPLGLPRSLAAERPEPICPSYLSPGIMAKGREESVVSPYKMELEEEVNAIMDQPYRTTPLVLPGAKVKRDTPPSESYLRHHPNPMFRQAPPHPIIPQDIQKQKVTDTVIKKVEEDLGPGIQVVHKQFNSPIGLYSEQNIVDQINAQTGVTLPVSSPPPLQRTNSKLCYKKTVVYDPSKSETFKALQDDLYSYDNVVHEVPNPVQTKVFSPVKKPQPQQQPQPVPHPVPGPQPFTSANPTTSFAPRGQEEIQQSYTFKRLMHMVQNEGY